MNRRSDGTGERHQRQRRPAHLEGARASAAPLSAIQALERSNFVDKLRDVVGLYVDPRPTPFAFARRKEPMPALDRPHAGLPLKKGRLGTMTHDYKRHGAATLFTALNVLDETIIGRNINATAIRSSCAS